MKVKIDELDKLVSEYVRKRAKGYCQRCGNYRGWKNLEACHFHSRSKKSVRYDEDNLVALDFGCHQYFHGNPLEFVEWFKAYLGELNFDLLNSRMRNTWPRPDKKMLLIYYQDKLKEL